MNNMNNRRLLADIPRGFLWLAVIVGGGIALLLTTALHLNTFVVLVLTLGLTLGFIWITARIYRALRGSVPGDISNTPPAPTNHIQPK